MKNRSGRLVLRGLALSAVLAPTLAWAGDSVTNGEFYQCHASLLAGYADTTNAGAPLLLKSELAYPKNDFTILTADGVQVVKPNPRSNLYDVDKATGKKIEKDKPQFVRLASIDASGKKVMKLYRFTRVNNLNGEFIAATADEEAAYKKLEDAVGAGQGGEVAKLEAEVKAAQLEADKARAERDAKQKGLHISDDSNPDQQKKDEAEFRRIEKEYLDHPANKRLAAAKVKLDDARKSGGDARSEYQNQTVTVPGSTKGPGVDPNLAFSAASEPFKDTQAGCGALSSELTLSDGFLLSKGAEACKVKGHKPITQEIEAPVKIKCNKIKNDLSEGLETVRRKVTSACRQANAKEIEAYENSAGKHGLSASDGVEAKVTLGPPRTTTTTGESVESLCEKANYAEGVSMKQRFTCTIQFENKPCEAYGASKKDNKTHEAFKRLTSKALTDNSACAKAAKACGKDSLFAGNFAAAKKASHGSGLGGGTGGGKKSGEGKGDGSGLKAD